MSVETLRRAAALMRERAEAATNGGHGWRLADLPGANEVWADRDAAGHDAFLVATTATRLNPNPGIKGYHDAQHIASWHPAVALAVADWLDAVAAVHWPKRHDRYSSSHYNAEPEHEDFTLCDETCWEEAFICNGCGTSECKPEISGSALTVARAYLGEQP